MNAPADPAVDAARHAVEVGRAALERGESLQAVRWFQRARRLAPNNPVALHLLISAIAQDNPLRALALSAELVASEPGDREAQIGRVALLHRCGHHDEASAALDALLRRFSAPRSVAFATLARQVARQVNAAGWVGATSAGAVLCHAPDLRLTLDGATLHLAGTVTRTLPAHWAKARVLRAVSAAGNVLGGTIDLMALRLVEGFVEFHPLRGLRGWALCPADPDAVPVIEVWVGAARKPVAVVLADDSLAGMQRLETPHARGFSVPLSALPQAGVLHVRAGNGAALAGSPLRVGAAAARADKPPGRSKQSHPRQNASPAGTEAQLWAKGRARTAIVLVTHAAGGGVERHIADRIASIRDARMRAIVVRPGDAYVVSDGADDTHPNLTFPTVETLAAFLRADHPGAVELHHIAAHAPGVERLAGLLRVPFDIVLHDYSAICPRVTLSTRGGAYCGEPPDARDCDDCIADRGACIPFTGRVADLRAAQDALFAVARAVIAPTHDAARRLRRYMPRIQPLVRPWQDDTQVKLAAIAQRDAALHVAICGAISPHKGYNVLLACARNAARRDLKLHFTVVGHTVDDARLLATGRVFVTGPYAEGEEVELLRETAADIGFIPSVWPETWCFALSHLWRAGLHVLAFDLGAQAERVAAHGGGTLVPLGMSAALINDTLLSLPTKGSVGGAVPAPPTPPSRVQTRASKSALARIAALGLWLAFVFVPGLASAHFSIADYAPPGTVLDNTGHADASAALAGAIRAANMLTAKGEPACVYIPPGTYRIVTPPPAFARAGCVKGDGPTQSTLSIDPAFSGDLFAWSEAWWPTTPGPTIVGLRIRGSAGVTKPQNAMVFYDRNDQVFIDNVEVDQLHGRALYSGVKLHTPQAYMRESHMRSLRFFMDGAPGVPVVEFSSEGQGATDATNEIAMSQVDIYGAAGPGLVIRNNGSGGVRDITIEALRIEGWEAGNGQGDLLTIGDPRMRGNVNNIRLTDAELIDPQAGFAALRLTAAPGTAAPYMITFSGLIGGGLPRGEGLRIDAGRASVFRFSGIHTFSTNIVVGRGVGQVVLDGGGQEAGWSFLVDASSWLGVSVPSLKTGGWRK